MTDPRHLLRLELAAGALAATLLLTMLLVGIDAVRFHRATLGAGWISPAAAPLTIVMALEALCVSTIGVSLLRQFFRQRAFLARLPGEHREIHGECVLAIPTRRPHAFCVGLLRPQIVISDGLLALPSDRELLSVIAHEAHHARRRDPLRRALAQAMCDAFWFIPALRTTATTQETISELAADAVAARSAGVEPLAAALVTFEDLARSDTAGPSPERVRQLAGQRTRGPNDRWSTVVAAAVILALAGGLVYLLKPVPAEVCLPLSTAMGLPLAVVVLSLACVPAGLLGRTAARAVRAPATELV